MLTWPFSLLAFKKFPPCQARTTRSRGNKNRQAGEAMAEFPNSAIKLFGKTIPLKPSPSTLSPASSGQGSSSIEEEKDIENQEVAPESKEQDHEPKQQSGCNEKQVLKKPTKILPCPRCSSTDTKFCYFNNYNVNQPRHFCKKCQRYWTAGGAMRDVPVGSGRRKTKNTDAGVKDIVRSGISEQVHGASGCSTVLSFGGHRSVAPPPSAEHLNEPYATAAISSSMESPWPYHCIPIPFFPVAAYWSVPWASPIASVSPGDGCARGEGTNYSILGKRSRNGTLFKNQAAEASQLLHHANPAALA